jgi:hypothetical protein
MVQTILPTLQLTDVTWLLSSGHQWRALQCLLLLTIADMTWHHRAATHGIIPAMCYNIDRE